MNAPQTVDDRISKIESSHALVKWFVGLFGLALAGGALDTLERVRTLETRAETTHTIVSADAAGVRLLEQRMERLSAQLEATREATLQLRDEMHRVRGDR